MPEYQEEPLKIAYRIDEAAKACGLGRSFLYEQMASGDLKSIKIGGRRLILREDLLAFLHRAEAGPIVKLNSGEKLEPRSIRKSAGGRGIEGQATLT